MDGERDNTRGPGGGRRRGDGDGTDESARQAKRDAYVSEISARLRHICQHLTDDEFARLVADVAETKLRFAAIDAGAWPRRPRESGDGEGDRTAPAGPPPGASP